jgi:hypothetical protein
MYKVKALRRTKCGGLGFRRTVDGRISFLNVKKYKKK